MSLPVIDICCEGLNLSKLSLDFSRHVKNRDIDEENVIKAITMMHVDSYKLLKKCLNDERREPEMQLIIPMVHSIYEDTIKYMEEVNKYVKDQSIDLFESLLPLLHDEDINQDDLSDERKAELANLVNQYVK